MALSTGSKVFVGIVVLAVGGTFGALNYVDSQVKGSPVATREPVVFVVASGETVETVGNRLESEGIVPSAFFFKLSARNDLGSSLQAGTYDLTTGMSVDEAIAALQDGPRKRETGTFRVEEGLTVDQTLARLAEQTEYSVADYRAVLDARLAAGQDGDGLLDLPDWVPPLDEFGPEVREPFEGMFMPDTYDVFLDESALGVLQRMVNELKVVVADITQEQIAAADARGLTQYDMLTLASLIERETRVPSERVTVSGVIANRLEIGQLLQIDATVLYALGETKERVLFDDLEVDSPYNTYVTPGIPPTPISGAGRRSIQAAYTPEDHGFFYYVLDPVCDGTHRFGATLSEHNRNVADFRSGGRCGVS